MLGFVLNLLLKPSQHGSCLALSQEDIYSCMMGLSEDLTSE